MFNYQKKLWNLKNYLFHYDTLFSKMYPTKITSPHVMVGIFLKDKLDYLPLRFKINTLVYL